MHFRILPVLLCLFLAVNGQAIAWSDEPVFSGPQVGEELLPFEAKSVFGEPAGEVLAVLESESNAPTLLVFVHQVTRPSIGLTRLVMNYAATKKDAGLNSHLVFLTADPTETEAWLRRARGALPTGVSPLISTDGVEGPGAYGLDRKMTLTILVARDGKVIANFPLVQPSIQVDGPKIGREMEKALGNEKVPTLADMGFREPTMRTRGAGASAENDGVYRSMMSPLIQKNATPADVETAAKEIEAMAATTPWFRERVGKAANQIVSGDRLSNYGTTKAQEYLTKWAREMKAEARRDQAPTK